jgi:hypothetical protein
MLKKLIYLLLPLGLLAQNQTLSFSKGTYQESYRPQETITLDGLTFNLASQELTVINDTAGIDEDHEECDGTRWLSLDPLAAKYPSVSPYVYVKNNPIIYIDPDGRENLYALNWARELIKRNPKIGYQSVFSTGVSNNYLTGMPSDYDLTKDPSQLVCWESCWIAYVNSGKPILDHLKKTGFAREVPNGPFGEEYVGFLFRIPWTNPLTKQYFPGGINWFKSGKGDRAFVKDINKGELGDMVFMGNSDVRNEGHAVLLDKLPVAGKTTIDGKEYETMELGTLSTGADNGYFGEKKFTFINKDGQWKTSDGYVFDGYGQMKNTNELMKDEKK